MASWFIIGLATITLVGIMMFAGANLVAVMGSFSQQSETVTRLNKVVDAVLASAWQDGNGDIHLPMTSYGVTGVAAGVSILPNNLTAQGVSGNGYPFIYCPFGDLSTAHNSNVYMPSGASYEVGVSVYEGTNYVVSGRPAYADAATNQDLLGFVIAPANKNGTYRGCDTITGSNGTYSAPNMYVKPLLRSRAVAMTLAPGSINKTIYVTTSGTGTGVSPSNPASLTQALATWRENPYVNTTIQLGSGTYSTAATALTSSASDYVTHPSNATLVLQATSGTTINTSDGLNLPVNIVLNNLSISGAITVQSGNFVNASNDTITGGSVTLNPNSTFNGSNIAYSYNGTNAFVLGKGSVANFYGSNSFAAAAGYSAFNLSDGATLNFSPNSNGYIDNFSGSTSANLSIINAAANSTVNMNNVTVNANSGSPYFVNTYGTLNMNSATMVNNAGGTSQLLLNSGSVGNINNSLLEALESNTINVTSNAAKLVTGSGSQMFNGTYITLIILGIRLSHAVCWQDTSGNPMFVYSGTTVGSYSTVPANTAVTALTGTPTAAQIQTYESQVLMNVGLSSARQRNLSNWQCV